MAPKRNNRFPVGQFMKQKQAANIEKAKETLELSSELKLQQQKIRRLKEKINCGKDILAESFEECQIMHASPQVNNKTRSPTSLVDGKCSESTLKRRRTETFDAACRIHGCTKSDNSPALDGLFDTLNKRCKTDVLGNYVLSNNKLTTYVIDKRAKQDRIAFEKSDANVKRSIATYYTAGVMGKRKYNAVRISSSMKRSNKKRGGRTQLTFMSKCPVPKLLTYNQLAQEIKKIDIGSLYSVEEEFKQYIEDENVRGSFRDLREYLPRLAQFYYGIYTRRNALKWFGKTEGTFLVAFGGDGAPFGKHETDCSFLVSFLNTGKRVASSSDNFLVFGANCDETSLVVKKYIQAACKQVVDLENQVIEINGLHCTFKFEEMPNDMKMMAMLAGELPNSATYFSTFANVNKNDMCDLKGTFGDDLSCKWRPWPYDQRIKVVKEVEAFKASIADKPMTEKVRRSKITAAIASKKSRQEFVPFVGELINKAHAEPLYTVTGFQVFASRIMPG